MPARKNRKTPKASVLRFERMESRRMLAAHVVGDPTVYATIQAAVNAALAGGVITVDAGTYGEQVVVGKPLTIKGAQAGVDARIGARVYNQTPEAIVTGTTNVNGKKTSAFYIASDDVTIDGFTMQGQTSQADTGAGIVIAPGMSGTHFFNNVVQNNVSGLFLANFNPAKPAIIQHNLFRNNNNAGQNGGRGIYSNGSISGGNLDNVIIDGNAFFNNRGTTDTTGVEAAISIQAFATNAQKNITITNNVFDSNGKAVLFFNTDNILIDNNYITNTLDQWSGMLRFEGNNHNVTITHNTIYSNTGPAVAVDAKGVPGDNSGFVVTNNNIYGNSLAWGSKLGVVFDNTVYIGAPDVRNNYWGAANGPGGDGPGSGDKVYGKGHTNAGAQWSFSTGGNELFSPWSSSLVGSGLFPYFGAAPTDNMIVQVEDFDHGGEGVGYHDAETTNQGGKTYRKYQGVDLETTTDSGAGYDVGYVKPGEWLNYSMFLPLGGVFTFQVRVANQGVGGNFHFEVDGVNVTGAMTMPNTGGYQTWTTMSKTGVNLTAGNHVVRLVMDTAPNGSVGNFNWFKLINTAPAMIPPAIPGGLLATPVDQTHVSLSWLDNSDNELNFIVERKTGAGGVWQQLATLGANTTSFIDATTVGGTTYSYRIRSVGYGGTSDPSNESTATTPAAPTIVYLSDLTWTFMDNGFGPVKKDLANGGSDGPDGQTIKLNGVTYAKGLGAHAPSTVIYNLTGGGYSTFQSDIGIDDRQTANGSVIFQVFLDGVKVFDSGVMGALSPTQSINLDVTGKSELKLVVTDGGDGTQYDHADWAGARLLIPPAPPLPPSAPAAPTNLVATPISYTQVNLSWDNVAGETGYIIERSTDGVTFTQVGTTLADITTFSDTTATPGTAYSYRARATNVVGDSDNSTIATATTPALPPIPAIPSALSATPISYKRVDLSWSDVAVESGYKIERSLDGVTFTPLGTTLADVTTYSDLTAAANTHYYYRVRANNITGDSDASVAADTTTPLQPLPPSIPSGLTASAISGTRIDLSWSDVSGETGYKIERSLDGIVFTPLTTVAADQTTFSDLTVSPNTQYFYRVRAANDAGDSDASLVANATTPMVAPAAPSGLAAVAGPGLIVNLTWTDGSNNEDGFRIERSTDNVNFAQIVGVFSNKTTYADTSVVAGQQYYYRVIAYNNAGLSPASNVATATAPTAPAAPSGLAAVAGSSAQITLNWTDNANNETGFRIERSSDNITFAPITTLAANAISYIDASVVNGQTYSYRVIATNAVGDSAASNVASATVAAAPMGPSISADIGSTGAAGSTSKSGGVYTVKGAGADIYGTSDAFQFSYMQLTGNGTIIARVTSLQNVDAGAKAGIMFRDSLAANAREASVAITPLNGIKFLTRSSTGGQTTSVSTATTLKAPYWLKLVRSGNTFTSYRSPDGVTWTQIGTQTVTMGSTVYVGLAVSSHKAGTLATATFDNVSVV